MPSDAGRRRPPRSCPRRCARRRSAPGARPAASRCAARPTRPGVLEAGRLCHEDDVDVGDIVELVATALAHRDHREPGVRRRRADPLPSHGERGVQRRAREVGELGGRVVDAEVMGEVACGQAQQHPAVLHAQGVERLGVRSAGGRHRVCRISADGTQQARADGVRRRPGRAERRVGELVPVRGMPDEVVAEGLAGAEHAHQTHRSALVADQHVEQLVVARVRQPDEARQRQVGVGRPAEERQQRLGGGTELAQARASAVDVVEAEGEQPPTAGPGVRAAHDTRWPTTARKVAASGAQAVVSSCSEAPIAASMPSRSIPRSTMFWWSPSAHDRVIARSTSGCHCRPHAQGCAEAPAPHPGRCGPAPRCPGRLDHHVVVPVHPDLAGAVAGERPDQRVVLGLSRPADPVDPDLVARGVHRDRAAQRRREQLVPEAEAQGRHPLLHRPGEQALGRADPGERPVVVRAHRTAQDEQGVVRRRIGEAVTDVGAADLELRPGLLQPATQQGGRGVRLVLDDEHLRGHRRARHAANLLLRRPPGRGPSAATASGGRARRR